MGGYHRLLKSEEDSSLQYSIDSCKVGSESVVQMRPYVSLSECLCKDVSITK